MPLSNEVFSQQVIKELDALNRRVDDCFANISKNASGRPVLSAARTYYVRADGNDTNSGLTNTAGGAFLTIQKAIDTAILLDNGGFDITISIADGTYTITTPILLKSFVGNGKIIIQGNTVTPTNVIISQSTAGVNGITASRVFGVYYVKDFRLVGNTSNVALYIYGSMTNVQQSGLSFSTGWSGAHQEVRQGATLDLVGAYTITGGSANHFFCSNGRISTLLAAGAFAITLTGTPNFTSEFISVLRLGFSQTTAAVMSFVGAATGKRYTVTVNGVIETSGGGANYFPGNAVGTTGTGGLYS